MSQWGPEKTFAGNGAAITAVPKVATPMWQPALPGNRIEYVLVIDQQGDDAAEQQRLKQAADNFVGRSLREWIAPRI